MFSSCSKEDASVKDLTPNDLSNKLSNGTWVVDFYEDRGTNKTSNYAGFEFNFGADLKLKVYRSNNLVAEGTWGTLRDDGRLVLDINLPDVGEPLEELEEDWKLIRASDDKIETEDTQAGRNDFLNFKKR